MLKLKCLSLYQPYATLCVIGAKRFETRGRDTELRGTIGIHSTKAYPDWCKDLATTKRFRDALEAGRQSPEELPQGYVIGTVDIVNTHRTDVWLADRQTGQNQLDPEWENEFHFGDYSGGRFAWELANPILFNEPIAAKGSQGFWYLNT